MQVSEQATIAPFVLVRLSGTAVSTLLQFRADGALSALEEADALTRRRDALAGRLSEELHALIPALPDEDRRVAIRLRRDIHNGRPPRPASAVLDRVVARIGPGFATWLELRERSAAAAAHYERTLESELAASYAALAKHSGDGALARALSVAAPEILAASARADAVHGGSKQGRRLARTLFNYLIRAAVKTSPLGWLSPVAVCTIGEGAPAGSGESGSYRAVASLPHPLYFRLLQRLWAREDVGCGVRFHPPARIGDGRVVRSSYFHTRTNGFFWREDVLTDAAEHAREVTVPGDGALGSAVLASLREGDPAAPWTRVARLTDAGLIRGESAWPAGAYDAHHAVAGLAPHGTPFAESLSAIGEDLRLLADSEPRERAAITRRLVRRAHDLDEATATATSPRIPELSVREDVVRAQPLPPLPEWVGEALSAYGRRLASVLVVLPQYAASLRFWQRHVAPEHDWLPLPAFLARYMATPGPHLLDNLDARLRAEPPVDVRPGPSTLLPAFAVLFQATTLEDGERVIVVNQIMDGVGSVAARFRALFEPELLTGPLDAWLAHLTPSGSRPLELTVATDWNPIQARSAGRARPLDLGGGMAPRSGFVSLEQLRIRLDQATGTLVVEDATGPVVPFYSGLVPRRMLKGVANILSTIASPWFCAAPEAGGTSAAMLRLDGVDGVVHRPRERLGPVVVRRAHWAVRAAELLAAIRRPTMAGTFAAYRSWAAEHGLPDQVFVRRGGVVPDLYAKGRKPLWLSASVPLSLSALLDSLTEEDILVMEEALPVAGRDSVMIDGLPRMTEYVAHLSWGADG
ncbi:lantibiotic dehydratase [Nonomuraea sp. SMC257]|uniref:Lantibiotic dehydratase n=1 Tax=Nonomuraea montanisoli TaxID=2741721 RepID=A0A7Y6M7E5_9ACTN|nr:lantibiotic dehydratase [Nonomuraea montanisoli]NUW36605.1 lantibiotic dehydratase [Nonomuraea montanisoli]